MATEKKLYKIGYLAKTLGVTHRTIRYYDQLGLLPHMKRSSGGVRLFDDEDIKIIKEVRRLQKEEYLPLDIIKEKLFQHEQQSNIAVITDSEAIVPNNCIRADRIIQTKQSDEAIVNDFKKTFLKLLDQNIQKIYSIHSGEKYSKMIDLAKQAISDIKHNDTIEIINSRSTGISLGLLISQIQQAVNKNSNITNTDLLIQKLEKLTYQIGFFKSIDFMIANEDTGSASLELLKSSSKSFSPIFKVSPDEAVHFTEIQLNTESAYERIKEILFEEIELRGKYISECLITYSYLYSEANQLANDLREKYTNTTVHLIENKSDANFNFGQAMLAAAII